MAQLKVFETRLGFHDTVVAAPSKTAALKAWGTHQDLFGGGSARLSEDARAIKAALAQPGVVLRRAAGSSGAYEAQADLSAMILPPKAKAQGAKATKDKAAKPPKPPKPPDRSALSQAEDALTRRRARYDKARAALDARRRELDAEAQALTQAYDQDRKVLDKARARAALDYARAGGEG